MGQLSCLIRGSRPHLSTLTPSLQSLWLSTSLPPSLPSFHASTYSCIYLAWEAGSDTWHAAC